MSNTKVNDATAVTSVQIDNVNYGAVKLVVLPELVGTYDDYWFLLDCSHLIRPLSLQVRKEAVPLMDTNPATLQRTGKVDVMASGRLAAAPTFPHMAYASIA